MRLRSLIAGALAAALLVGTGAAAWAKPPRRIAIDVTVSHALDAQGAIDPRGVQLDAYLKPQFRYGGLKVLQEERLDLALDQVGTLQLPNGRKLRLRPLDIGSEGLLLSVSVQGTLWTDMRIRNGHLVVIGAERYEAGKLVIGLEPHF
ncbi:MAG TPA: hypothetical protein VII72_10095 [Myxococcota bacterium]